MRMTRNAFHFIICTLLSLTVSCTNGDIIELLRSYDDPSDDTTVVDCYSEPYTIKLIWKEDEATDTFILLRAEDNGAENFRQIYSGKATSYIDRFSYTNDQKRYIYRLDKTRGNRRFYGSECACAVVSATLNDTQEPNNTLENAVELQRIITATMPCSQFNYKGKAFGDEDWYFIRLNPMSTAMISFTQIDMNGTAQSSEFKYMEQGSSLQSITNTSKITVENTDMYTKNIYFKIVPDLEKKFQGSAGAAVLSYRLELSEVSFR